MSRDPQPGRGEPTDTAGTADGTARTREGEPAEPADVPTFDEGRYVYCVVRTGGDDAFGTDGVEGEPVRVVSIDGIGAVVHECDDVYDSADPAEIRRWLVRHQAVVDDAAEAFGTPLPFQFDTIIRGDDAVVREWLRSERDTLASTLDALDGHWEYRIEVVRTEPIGEETLADEDEQLADLREEIDAAEPGTAYLLEKRYEDRLDGLRTERRGTLTADVRERVATRAREVHELDASPSRSQFVATDASRDAGDETETVCRLTALAHEDDEEALGAELDAVAAEPDLEVRFTGPWPPYTFAPEFGDGSGSPAGSEP